MATKRAAIYARSSNIDRKEDLIPAQIEECEQYCGQRGYVIVWKAGDEITGKKRERPRLDEVYDLAEAKKIDVVVVREVDRMVRSVGTLSAIEEILGGYGVPIEYVRGQYADTPEGRAHKNMAATFAQYEAEKIAERLRRGRIRKLNRGQWMGSGRAPFGYVKRGKREDARLEIDPTEAEVVKRIFNLYVHELKTTGEICAMLEADGIKTKLSKSHWRNWNISYMLGYTGYVGVFSFNGIDVHLPHLRIISDELFSMAQKRREDMRSLAKSRVKRHVYELTGRFECWCSSKMIGHSGEAIRPAYRCFDGITARGRPAKHNCANRLRIRADRIEAFIWNWLVSLVAEKDNLKKVIEDIAGRREKDIEPKRRRLAALDKAIAKLDARAARAMLLVDDEDIDDDDWKADVKIKLKALADEKTRLKSDRDRLEREIQQQTWIMEVTPDDIVNELDQIGISNDPYARRRAYARYDVRLKLGQDDLGITLELSCILSPKPVTIGGEALLGDHENIETTVEVVNMINEDLTLSREVMAVKRPKPGRGGGPVFISDPRRSSTTQQPDICV